MSYIRRSENSMSNYFPQACTSAELAIKKMSKVSFVRYSYNCTFRDDQLLAKTSWRNTMVQLKDDYVDIRVKLTTGGKDKDRSKAKAAALQASSVYVEEQGKPGYFRARFPYKTVDYIRIRNENFELARVDEKSLFLEFESRQQSKSFKLELSQLTCAVGSSIRKYSAEEKPEIELDPAMDDSIVPTPRRARFYEVTIPTQQKYIDDAQWEILMVLMLVQRRSHALYIVNSGSSRFAGVSLDELADGQNAAEERVAADVVAKHKDRVAKAQAELKKVMTPEEYERLAKRDSDFVTVHMYRSRVLGQEL